MSRFWIATAELQVGSVRLDQSLTFQAADFTAAITKARQTFAESEITSVGLARCTATRWDDTVCDTLATQLDGLCDDCRDTFEAHRAADPHCTCNDCMEHYTAEATAASDAADHAADCAGWRAEGGIAPLDPIRQQSARELVEQHDRDLADRRRASFDETSHYRGDTSAD